MLAVGCMWMTENHGMPVSWIPSGENGVASVGLLASIPITWPRPSRSPRSRARWGRGGVEGPGLGLFTPICVDTMIGLRHSQVSQVQPIRTLAQNLFI